MNAARANETARWTSPTALTLLLLALTASQARAADVDLQTRSAARDLAVQGADAFEAKDYATALDRFNRAAALYPAPSISVMRARSLVKLGRWVEALDTYANVSSANVSADAPEAFRRAQSDAVSEASELRKNMPRLEIRTGQPAEQQRDELVVKLDGRVLPAALLDVEQPVDPGTHTVQAESGSAVVFRRALTVAERGRASVLVTPGSLDAASGTAAAEPAAPGHLPTSRRVWTYVAFGVGGLGFTVAAVAGSSALSEQSELDASCNPRCPRNADDTRASISSSRTLAYTGLAVGAAGTGVGVYLLLSGRSDASQVTAQITATGAAIRGTF